MATHRLILAALVVLLIFICVLLLQFTLAHVSRRSTSFLIAVITTIAVQLLLLVHLNGAGAGSRRRRRKIVFV